MKTTNKKTRPNWRPFEKARQFVRSLGLKNQDEWRAWVKSDLRFLDIPTLPSQVYKNQGWVSWSDWLGTKNIATANRQFMEFKDARLFARNLGLKSNTEWGLWAKTEKRPLSIPSNPQKAYANKGWISWGDWLGTKNKRGNYRQFDEARKFAREIGLKTISEWRAWAKTEVHPNDIPSHPQRLYKKSGWISWGDWLGTGQVAFSKRMYRSFSDARSYARNLGLENYTKWRSWAKSDARPDDIPAAPRDFYQEQGWISWGDWLGTDSIWAGKRVYKPFLEARAFVRSLGLKGEKQYRIWSKSANKPDDVPTHPDRTYKTKGWKSWSDWLGTRNIKGGFRSFQEARDIARSLGFADRNVWQKWSKTDARPNDIPATPDRAYKGKGWISWGDWLGTGSVWVGHRTYRTFQDARAFARSIGLKNKDEWAQWAQSAVRPTDIPANPPGIYQGQGWIGWWDWLGTKNRKSGYRQFNEAKSFVRGIGLKGKDEWTDWSKSNARPDDIPANPPLVYRNAGWAGWGDWLGIINRWNETAILNFLYSIKPILRDLQPAELFAIMRQNGLIAAIRNTNNSNAPLIKSIRDLCSSLNSY